MRTHGMDTLLVKEGLGTGHGVVAGKLDDEGYPTVTVSPEGLGGVDPDVSTEGYGGVVVLGGDTHRSFGEESMETLRLMAERGAFVGAVGTGVVVLARAGITNGRLVSCDKEVTDEVAESGATVVPEPVAVDGKFVTARSDAKEGFAGEFHRKLRRARVKGL